MDKNRIVANTLVFIELLEKGVTQAELFHDIHLSGLKKVEVRREWIKSYDEFEEMKTASRKYGLEIYYSIPDLLFQQRMIPLAKLQSFLEEAQQMGCKKVKMTAGNLEELSTTEVAGFNQLLEEYEIDLFTIENDQVKEYSNSKDILQTLAVCKEIGLNVSYTYDFGNFVYVDEGPFDRYHELKQYIGFVHVKDVLFDTKETVLLGEGDIEWSQLVNAVLYDLPQSVDLAIEYPCGSNPKAILENEINKFIKGERK